MPFIRLARRKKVSKALYLYAEGSKREYIAQSITFTLELDGGNGMALKMWEMALELAKGSKSLYC